MSQGHLEAVGERFWESLLNRLCEGKVIPVIGPELIRFEHEGEEITLERLLARRLSAEFEISGLPPEASLQTVVAAAYSKFPRADFHERICEEIAALGALPIPPALAALARIRNFRLFLSLSFDSLVMRALEEVVEMPVERALMFSPKSWSDLPRPVRQLDGPYTYALFGRSSLVSDFVISDDDRVEWMTALQDPDNRPKLLFDALRENHLLFLGCALPDWFLRLLLRLTREGRFTATRQNETLVGEAIDDQASLIAFLEHFSPNTTFLHGDPVRFVAELESRWQKRNNASLRECSQNLPPEVRRGGVFISYASEDREAVRCVYAALRDKQVDTWCDFERLQSGDLYEQSINRNIGLCGVFIVALSAKAEQRLAKWNEAQRPPETKPFFLKEWEKAISRQQLYPDSGFVICPVRVDGVNPESTIFPAELRPMHCPLAAGGAVDEAFSHQIKGYVREFRRRNGGGV